jgi:hypothetical protein
VLLDEELSTSRNVWKEEELYMGCMEEGRMGKSQLLGFPLVHCVVLSAAESNA